MPIVQSKRKREAEKELEKSKRQKTSSIANKYQMYSKIGFMNDLHHTVVRGIPYCVRDDQRVESELERVTRKEVGSFLNGKGGILAFGVRSNGTILGVSLGRWNEDRFKLAIDRVMTSFHPLVKPSMYKLLFTQVYDVSGNWDGTCYLVQLKVNKGEQYNLYEDAEHEVHVRCSSAPKGPLTAQEIKHRVITEYNSRQQQQVKPPQAAKATVVTSKQAVASTSLTNAHPPATTASTTNTTKLNSQQQSKKASISKVTIINSRTPAIPFKPQKIEPPQAAIASTIAANQEAKASISAKNMQTPAIPTKPQQIKPPQITKTAIVASKQVAVSTNKATAVNSRTSTGEVGWQLNPLQAARIPIVMSKQAPTSISKATVHPPAIQSMLMAGRNNRKPLADVHNNIVH